MWKSCWCMQVTMTCVAPSLLLYPLPAARTNMMMRFTKVTPEGDYVPPPPANSKASYATMLFVRADIVKNSGGVLSKAVTIATRYAAVRRQTAPGAGV